MTVRNIKVSPDGDSVAIRSDFPAESWNAWGVMSALHGGHWSSSAELEGWTEITLPE